MNFHPVNDQLDKVGLQRLLTRHFQKNQKFSVEPGHKSVGLCFVSAIPLRAAFAIPARGIVKRLSPEVGGINVAAKIRSART